MSSKQPIEPPVFVITAAIVMLLAVMTYALYYAS